MKSFMEKKNPVFIAFSNQKGGVGKSVFTVLSASYYHYMKGKTVLVVDCDYPQYSIQSFREREKKQADKNNTYKNQIAEFIKEKQIKAYSVINCPPDKAKQVADKFLSSTEIPYDFVFFDLPGTVNSQGVLESIMNMDYVITPILMDRMVMQSSLSFISTIKDFVATHKDLGIPLKEIYIFWNKIDKRVSSEVKDNYNEIMGMLNLKVLDSVIYDTERFNKEMSPTGKAFFRSTLLPPPEKLIKGTGVDLFYDELSTLIGI